MLEALKSLFADTPREAAQFGPRDLRVAAAVLLTHLVGVDGEVNALEKTRLVDLLAEHFALSEDDARALARRALERGREAVDIDEFTSLLARTLDETGRRDIVAMMWEMARADGKVSEFEESAIWRAARLLGALDPKAFAAEAMRPPARR